MMSPFKEFVHYAKRYNNVQDKEPGLNDLAVDHQKSSRHKSHQRHNNKH